MSAEEYLERLASKHEAKARDHGNDKEAHGYAAAVLRAAASDLRAQIHKGMI